MTAIDPITNISQGLLTQGVQTVIGKYNNVNVANANQFLSAGGANILMAVGTGDMNGAAGAVVNAVQNLSPGSVTSTLLARVAPGLPPIARQVIANGVLAANNLFGNIVNNSLTTTNLPSVSNYYINNMFLNASSPAQGMTEVQQLASNMNAMVDMIRWTLSQGINTSSSAYAAAQLYPSNAAANHSTASASNHDFPTLSPSGYAAEQNGMTTIPRSYAQDLSDLFPKHNFLFLVVFNFNSDFKKIQNKFTFLVKKCDRPDIQVHHEVINFYNFRSNVPTRTEFQPLTMSFHDDIMSESMNFFVSYMNQVCPIFTQQTQSSYEANGLTFDNTLTSSFNLASKSAVSVLSSIEVYHVYDFGRNVDHYTYMKPQVTKFKLSDLDMADATNCAEVRVDFVYDNVTVEAGKVADILSSLRPSNMSTSLQYNSTGATDKSGGVLQRDQTTDSVDYISGANLGLPYSSTPIDVNVLNNMTTQSPLTTGLTSFQNGLTNLIPSQADIISSWASDVASANVSKELTNIITPTVSGISETALSATSSLITPIMQQIGSQRGQTSNWISDTAA